MKRTKYSQKIKFIIEYVFFAEQNYWENIEE